MAVPMLRMKILVGYKVTMIRCGDFNSYFLLAEIYASSLALTYSGSWSLRDESMKAYINLRPSDRGMQR